MNALGMRPFHPIESAKTLKEAIKRYHNRQAQLAPYRAPIKTSDGAELAVRVFQPEHLRFAEVVLDVHGAFNNGEGWRLRGGENFVQKTLEAGFTTVVIDNRNHGRSRAGNVSPTDGFDKYVHDVGEIIDWIVKTTDISDRFDRRIHYIGHSCGEMQLMAFAGSHPEYSEIIATNTGLAGPTRVQSTKEFIQLILLTGATYNEAFNWLGISQLNPLRIPMEMMLPLGRKLPESIFAALLLRANKMGLDNIPPDLQLQFLADVIERLPIGLMNSLSANVATGRFCSADGKIDYCKLLTKVDIPSLFMVGENDVLVSPENVKQTHKLWGSRVRGKAKPEKEMIILPNQGHIGILFDGRAQGKTVEFLTAHSTPIQYSI